MNAKLQPNETLVLTLDFINDIVHPEGKIAHSAKRIADNHTVENANSVIKKARERKIPIAHVKVGFDANYQTCPPHSPLFSAAPKFNALQLNTWGTEFHEKLDVNENDYIIIKNRVSAFYCTKLETLLRAKGIKNIVLMGVATNMAVETTAREAHDRDYNVIIIQDACETTDQQSQEASLAVLQRLANVTDTHSFEPIFFNV